MKWSFYAASVVIAANLSFTWLAVLS